MTWEEEKALNRQVAALLEPMPEPISARALRATAQNFQWFSDNREPSPKGIWEGQIGTDHGDDDDAPVRWNPAHEFCEDIAAAWLVVEHLRQQGWIVRVQEMPDGLPFIGGAGYHPEENIEINRRAVCILHPNPRLDPDLRCVRAVHEFGESAPEAICRAALAAAKRKAVA